MSKYLTEKPIHPDTQDMIDFYDFDRIPVEGTLYKSTYVSELKTDRGTPAGTAIIALYSEAPYSASCFHRLRYDEVWHFYGGDPLKLILLHPNGSSEEIIMGSDVLNGEKVQYVIPAHTWQAGCIVPGGRYSLFANTMTPGFDGADFEAGIADELIQQYPDRKEDILQLSHNEGQTRMPEGYHN